MSARRQTMLDAQSRFAASFDPDTQDHHRANDFIERGAKAISRTFVGERSLPRFEWRWRQMPETTRDRFCREAFAAAREWGLA